MGQSEAFEMLAPLKNFRMKNAVVKRHLTKVLSYLISHEHFVFEKPFPVVLFLQRPRKDVCR